MYTGIVFSHIILRGDIDTGGWTRKANALFEYITALDGGVVGIFPEANGDVGHKQSPHCEFRE